MGILSGTWAEETNSFANLSQLVEEMTYLNLFALPAVLTLVRSFIGLLMLCQKAETQL